MEIEITDNLITRGLRKFSLRIFKNTYVIKESYNMLFCYNPQKDGYVNKFYMQQRNKFIALLFDAVQVLVFLFGTYCGRCVY